MPSPARVPLRRLLLQAPLTVVLAAVTFAAASGATRMGMGEPTPILRGAARPVLDAFIESQREASHIPGLAAAIVKGPRIAWARAYGLANIEQRRAATLDTPFLLASVSKAVTAVAILQLVEQKRLRLDEDIGLYVPFPVRHPLYPDVPITLRMLLRHTSSISDGPSFTSDTYSLSDSELPLERVLWNVLRPGGGYYDLSTSFYAFRPGTAYGYSNLGVALLGYLVEVGSGVPFDRYCREKIFQPLQMARTSWRLRELDPLAPAMPYAWVGETGYQPFGQYSYPAYPAGSLRASVLDVARFLRAILVGGAHGGRRILERETIEEMLRLERVDSVDQGLIWFAETRRGKQLLGHTGSDNGAKARMFFRREDGVGVVLLANESGDAAMKTLGVLLGRLFDEAASL